MMLDVDKREQPKCPTPVINNVLDHSPLKNSTAIKTPAILQWIEKKKSKLNCFLLRYPWSGWAFVYAVVLLVFFVYRCTAIRSLIQMYASTEEATAEVVLSALGLGFLEDFVCTTYFVCVLWLYDTLATGSFCTSFATKTLTFLFSWLLFTATMVPFVADVVIVRLRDVRFTFALVTMAIEEKDHADAMAVSGSQMTEAYLNVAALVLVATSFASVRSLAPWADLSTWNPTKLPLICVDSRALHTQRLHDIMDQCEDEADDSPSEKAELVPTREVDDRTVNSSSRYSVVAIHEDGELLDPKRIPVPRQGPSRKIKFRELFVRSIGLLFGLVLFPLFVVALSRASPPLVAYSALNTSLNEFFRHFLEPDVMETTPLSHDTSRPWAEEFIDKNELHTLLGNDTLYRRTVGFQGDLAFDVNVREENPPNVLVIVVESFRYHDSHYLVGDEDPSNLFNGSNITITPNFDRWANRGVALRNFWSSWRTSRSVESLLFGQLPYDSVTKSGMTGGQRNTTLAGLPQLFTAKGYETFFTTGCLTDYDNWDSFLPAHGFDTVWSRNEMKRLAESDLGINHTDWDGPEHRGLNWGVHDDVSFQLLGDLFVNKTKEQSARVAKGEAKKPLFLTHYTISSHVNYMQCPKWYHESKKPDFSALYKGQKYADNIKNYLEIRYFTDMEFGKFMDRMAAAGILEDTIVVISGDHGQGPEFGNDVPEDRDVSATRVAGAIVAEGRLGKAVGMVMDDATEQYDILNTLADITGVPEGGFEQDGVGRSLKRKIKFGERIVYSNNPTRKMSVVRGHERLRYDKVTDSMLLHNPDTDHDMEKDLLPTLTEEERAEWISWRDAGRRINSYYTKRWEGKCLLAAEC
ncbi:hypothetical protein V7S43_005571 [Phytophthora oleae]|uniref:Sulfatase N-terminal domain-containing protein n=1 Tax=Phytophthora oleae TaxID=2107226 RepID=A0ABD3FTB1_9STRA